MTHSYVLVEHAGGVVSPKTYPLLAAARQWGEAVAVVVGDKGAHEPLVQDLAAHGADRVVGAWAPDYAERLITPELDALQALASDQSGPVFVYKGPQGSEIGGRLGARLHSGFVNNVSQLNEDGTVGVKILADSALTTVRTSGASPVYALRNEDFGTPAPGAGVVSELELPRAGRLDAKVVKHNPPRKAQRPPISQAHTVIAGGRGVGDNGFTEYVEPLADVLGAGIGATRDVVELGWINGGAQIGLSGQVIAPQLYIGLGISGNVYHTGGIFGSNTIISINSDEEAPIFEISDLGVVGDVEDIVPALIAELKARQS